MPNLYDNFYLSNEIEDQFKSHLDLQRFCTMGLQTMAAEMTAGRYLQYKKACGQLTEFDLDAAVKSIQEGDTNITFAIGGGSQTPEQRLDALIASLCSERLEEVIRYRRLEW